MLFRVLSVPSRTVNHVIGAKYLRVSPVRQTDAPPPLNIHNDDKNLVPMIMVQIPLHRLPLFRRIGTLPQQHIPRSNAVSTSHPRRWMSVISLSDSDAVDKFRTIHAKSVMYFTASWCPPCKMIAPIYENLSKQYPDVAFGKIDVDNNQDSASEFQISAVPTFVFSKGKEAVNKFSGADKVQLEKLVKEL